MRRGYAYLHGNIPRCGLCIRALAPRLGGFPRRRHHMRRNKRAYRHERGLNVNARAENRTRILILKSVSRKIYLRLFILL